VITGIRNPEISRQIESHAAGLIQKAVAGAGYTAVESRLTVNRIRFNPRGIPKWRQEAQHAVIAEVGHV
jgi:hypothetical protein